MSVLLGLVAIFAALLPAPFCRVADAEERAASVGRQPALTDEQIHVFAELALKGLDQEFPNKPSNVMASAADVLSPRQMHPVFFGSFDWHSSVHGHWLLVRLLRLYPAHSDAGRIRAVLDQRLNAADLEVEAEYFRQPFNRSFERMYGWAWLLQLVAELHEWSDVDAERWRQNLRPLETEIVRLAKDYLPRLDFPIRTGVHPDTGFAFSLCVDYARTVGDQEFLDLLLLKSSAFYQANRDYPAHYEPSGNDFFSSGFNEADLMRRVLTAKAFSEWLDRFLPGLRDNTLGPMMVPVAVSDVTDGHLVHLAGLDLSRAWTMAGIASVLPDEDPRRELLLQSAEQHAAAGLRYVSSGDYAGEHWLATFAVYHLTGRGVPRE
ncbi:MAG: DUF2891 domain-containing protein [Planctomycetaceae bacterium]|nr:DUF2891 domain-containing protein [Planctomycetaceae bacterium]